MKKFILAVVFVFVASSMAYAYSALQDQWTKGVKRYCKYSDGTIITIEATELCPISID